MHHTGLSVYVYVCKMAAQSAYIGARHGRVYVAGRVGRPAEQALAMVAAIHLTLNVILRACNDNVKRQACNQGVKDCLYRHAILQLIGKACVPQA